MLLELVLILPFGAQEPSVENVGVRAIVGDGRVDFPQVDACAQERSALLLVFILAAWQVGAKEPIGRQGFVLFSRPADDHRLRQRPGPRDEQGVVAATIG